MVNTLANALLIFAIIGSGFRVPGSGFRVPGSGFLYLIITFDDLERIITLGVLGLAVFIVGVVVIRRW